MLLVSLVPTEVSAQENTGKVIRVGFYNMDGYHEQDEDGHRSGYGYEFLQKVGRYLPYRYEYVGYDKSWNEMLDMLEKGEIDILTFGGKTPEREDRFEYSRNAIGIAVTLIAVKKGNKRFTAREYDTYDAAFLYTYTIQEIMNRDIVKNHREREAGMSGTGGVFGYSSQTADGNACPGSGR